MAEVGAGSVNAERPETGLDGVLGVGHEADDIARIVRDSCDVFGRAVGVAHVAEDDESLPLEAVELLGGGDEVALAVLHGNDDLLPLRVPVGPGGLGVLHAQALLDADEALVRVAQEGAGQSATQDSQDIPMTPPSQRSPQGKDGD